MKKIFMLCRIVPILFSGIGFSVFAQEGTVREGLLFEEIPIVITASRQEEPVAEAPANIVVITEEMIKERGYLDIKDVFNDLPGFDLSTNVYGEFSTLIHQRGIGGNNKILLLLNGEKITSPSGKEFPYGHNVPLGYVKKIEIMYGPASALYGPDAFAVVNIITKSPEETNGLTIHTSAGQFNTYETWVLHSKTISNDINYSVFARTFLSNGQDLSEKYDCLSFIETGYPNSPEVRARYEDPVKDYNIDVTLNLKNLSVSFYRSFYKEQLSKGLIPEHYVYNKEAYWGQTIDKLSLKHIYSRDRLTLNSSFSLTVFEIDPKMNWYYIMPDEDYATMTIYQYGKTNGIRFEEQVTYTLPNNLNIITGILAEDITGLPVGDVVGEPFDRNSPLVHKNSYNSRWPQSVVSSQNYGIFGQIKFPHRDRLYLTIGGRYDYNTIYGGVINPRVGVVYKLHPNHIFKLLYGQAYIAPSYFYRYEVWFTADYGHVQNPDLKPEKLSSVELIWIQKWIRNMTSTMGIYLNNANDLIVRRGKGVIHYPEHWGDTLIYVEWNDNFGELESYGVDWRLDYSPINNLKFYINYSYMDGYIIHPEETYAGEKFDIFKTSKHKLAAGITVKIPLNLTITPRARWVSDIATRPENSEYEGNRMPGYTLVDLNIRYSYKKINLNLLVNNLLDKRYYTAGVASEYGVYLPRIPQNLRQISLGLTLRT